MARFFWVCILVLLAQAAPRQSAAQESLRILTGMEREQALNWSNPELSFDLNIPPGASAATLTLYADPGETLPAPGSMIIVSVNDHAGVVVDPRPEAFSARIDLPATQFKVGQNRIRISFEGAKAHSCPIKADGEWRLDLARSRFDLSISAKITSFAHLESWLSSGAWALARISLDQGALGQDSYAALGALVTQGLAVRAGRVPQIIASDRIAGLGFKALLDPGFAGPGIALRPGTHPVVEFQGRDEEEVLAMARLFSGRIINVGGTRATPVMLARAPLVRGSGALDGIKSALAQPSWNARPYVNTVRVPHRGKTRLVVDMERPDWVSPDSTVLISVDGQKPHKKRLKNTLNHFIIPLSRKSTTVVRSFSIAHETLPMAEQSHCIEKQDGAPLRLLSATIESNGYAYAEGLSRFAIDGVPFSQDTGAGSGIVLATKSDDQLRAAWRALGRVALVSGAPLTAAWYGTDYEAAPQGFALMVLGPRSQLSTQLVAQLPKVFAAAAAAGPGDYELQYKKRGYSVSPSAFADENTQPAGLGVAGWAQMEQRPVLVLTGDKGGDFTPAMQAFANGPAINFFAGKVVRWRAGLVEINDIGTGSGTYPQKRTIPAILFFIAGIALMGLWIRLWVRLYTNWKPL